MITPLELNGTEREQRLNEILLDYVEGLQQGKNPDREQMLRLHPEYAAELAEFFASREQLHRIIAPLQVLVAGFHDSGAAGVAMPDSQPAKKMSPYTRPELGQLGDYQIFR